jgi:hypothetical protein
MMPDAYSFSLALALLLAQAGQSRRNPADWEFGQIRIGKRVARLPSRVLATRYCLDQIDRSSCEQKLTDGIWYRFNDGRLVAKAMRVRESNHPWWVNPRDNSGQSKIRLERLTSFQFKIVRNDMGDIELHTVDQVTTSNNYRYDIIVIFRRGRMEEIYQTSLSDPDA